MPLPWPISAAGAALLALRPTLAAEQLTAVPCYDRSQLILETHDTPTNTLTEELVTTMLVVLVFLLHTRASIAIGLTLTLDMLLTFLVMNAWGVSANLMSHAGIAIAIGAMVDMGIVITENVFQHPLALLESLRVQGEEMPRSPWDSAHHRRRPCRRARRRWQRDCSASDPQ